MPNTIPQITLATDGSCLKNPGGPSGWAWVRADGAYTIEWDPSGTNQVAELWGLITALRDHPTGRLTIQMDSEYVINIATKWARGWQRNGWKTKAGEPVKNLPLVKALLRLMTCRPEGHTVQLVKVPGHDSAGRWPLNTAADQLAQKAARTAQSHHEGGVEIGKREPFNGALAPAPVRAQDGRGDAPGQRCASCNAVIQPVPPYCRCDMI